MTKKKINIDNNSLIEQFGMKPYKLRVKEKYMSKRQLNHFKKILKSWKVILPENTMLFPVGGIEPESIESYVLAGATGFGIGSALYKPGKNVLEVVKKGRAFITSWEKIKFSLNESK